METKIVQVQHGAKRSPVALFSGLASQELSSVLRSVFAVSTDILGLVAQDGLVVPLSMACVMPSILTGSLYTLLLAQRDLGHISVNPAIVTTTAEDLQPAIEEPDTFYANASAPQVDQQTQLPSEQNQTLPSSALATINAQNFSKVGLCLCLVVSRAGFVSCCACVHSSLALCDSCSSSLQSCEERRCC
jgi:hypothetical protein